MGQAFGGDVVRAPVPMHGKVSEIRHAGETVFRGINGPFRATRYHSLVVARDTCPPDLAVTAESATGSSWACPTKPCRSTASSSIPESILSEQGGPILRNFLDLAAAWNREKRDNAALLRCIDGAWTPSSPTSPRSATGAALTREEARAAFDALLSGEVTPAQAGGFLMALRVRGEAFDEIIGAVSAMRGRMLRVEAPAERHRHRRHRRRPVRQLQHLDARRDHRRRLRRAGRQARQPRRLVASRAPPTC